MYVVSFMNTYIGGIHDTNFLSISKDIYKWNKYITYNYYLQLSSIHDINFPGISKNIYKWNKQHITYNYDLTSVLWC